MWDDQLKDGNHEGLFAAFARQPADTAPVREDGEGGGGGGDGLAHALLQKQSSRCGNTIVVTI